MDEGVSGKRLIPALAVGCLIFAVVMGFGTYLVARIATPFFEKHAPKPPPNAPGPPAPSTFG